MQLSKWILLLTAIGVFLLVGITVFVPLQNAIRTIIPPNATDMPIVAVGRALMPYILLFGVPYAAFRIWKTRGN